MSLSAALMGVALVQAGESWEGRSYAFGDLHAHSGLSGDAVASDVEPGCAPESCGAVETMYREAAERGLDFVSVTDHLSGGAGMSAAGLLEALERMQEAERAQPELLTLFGVEMTLEWSPDGSTMGHRNLLLFAPPGELGDLQEEELLPGDQGALTDCAELQAWLEEVERRWGPSLLLPHHSGTVLPPGTDWSRCWEEVRAPVAEAYSEWGSSMTREPEYDPPLEGIRADGAIETALEAGLRMGLIASTDTHDTWPGDTCSPSARTPAMASVYGGGLAGVFLREGESLSRESLYAALMARRTYASSGPRLPLAAELLLGGEWVQAIGAELKVPAEEPIRLRLRLPEDRADTVLAVRWISSGSEQLLEPAAAGQWEAEVEPSAWGYLRLDLSGESGCEDGGADSEERIWVSPTWLEPTEEESSPDSPSPTGEDSRPAGESPSPSEGLDSPVSSAGSPAADRSGCGCATPSQRSGWWLPTLILLAVASRRWSGDAGEAWRN